MPLAAALIWGGVLCLSVLGCEATPPGMIVPGYEETAEIPAIEKPSPSPMPAPYLFMHTPEPPEKTTYTWGKWLILLAAWPLLWILKKVFFGRRRNKKVIIKKS